MCHWLVQPMCLPVSQHVLACLAHSRCFVSWGSLASRVMRHVWTQEDMTGETRSRS